MDAPWTLAPRYCTCIDARPRPNKHSLLTSPHHPYNTYNTERNGKALLTLPPVSVETALVTIEPAHLAWYHAKARELHTQLVAAGGADDPSLLVHVLAPLKQLAAGGQLLLERAAQRNSGLSDPAVSVPRCTGRLPDRSDGPCSAAVIKVSEPHSRPHRSVWCRIVSHHIVSCHVVCCIIL